MYTTHSKHSGSAEFQYSTPHGYVTYDPLESTVTKPSETLVFKAEAHPGYIKVTSPLTLQELSPDDARDVATVLRGLAGESETLKQRLDSPRENWRHEMKIDMSQLTDAEFVDWLKRKIEAGSISRLEIAGDGIDNATAVGGLLDIDPTVLASSRDAPLVIELERNESAFAVFGGVRFLDNQRLIDWLDMVQHGEFTGGHEDTAPSTIVLPRLKGVDHVAEGF